MERITLTTTTSTQDYAKEHIQDFSKQQYTIITAEKQTSGRGRQGHLWDSSYEEDIYATLVLFPPSTFRITGTITLLTALCIAQALQELGFRPAIKWPNDLLLSNKKVAGVLCEVTDHAGKHALLIGFGVNVNRSFGELSTIDQPATSLAVASHKKWDKEVFLEKITEKIEHSFLLFFSQSFPPFLAEYEDFLLHKVGDTMALQQGTKKIEGTFLGITEEGFLRLQPAKGKEILFSST